MFDQESNNKFAVEPIKLDVTSVFLGFFVVLRDFYFKEKFTYAKTCILSRFLGYQHQKVVSPAPEKQLALVKR